MIDVQQGQVLAGKYRVDQVLGSGGMGIVLAATHLQLEQRVAIKFLLPEALHNPESVSRFAREARAAVKIKSEHVVRVIDVSTLETGEPYMVMECLDGRDLAAVIRERGALPRSEAVDAILQACEALAEAHALGIVHRDLKPANLFLTRRPDGTTCIKVLDFGISKLINTSASDNFVTKTMAIFGSPLYMSPEQMASPREVDARSDIWAIGAILYELLTARAPFNGNTLPEIYVMIGTGLPRLVRDINPAIPEELQNVVLRCLEKDRKDRYQNIGELAAALTPFGSRATSRSYERIVRILGSKRAASSLETLPSSSESPDIVALQATQSSWGQTRPRRSIRYSLIAASIVVVLALSGGGLFLALRSRAASIAETRAPTSAQQSIDSRANAPVTTSKGTTAAAKEAAKTSSPAVVNAKSTTMVKPVHQSKLVQRKQTPRASATIVPTPTSSARRKPKTREELLNGRH